MKLSKTDEKNIRLAYRHYNRMADAFNRVKATFDNPLMEKYSVDSLLSMLLNEGATEDELVQYAKDILSEIKESQTSIKDD